VTDNDGLTQKIVNNRRYHPWGRRKDWQACGQGSRIVVWLVDQAQVNAFMGTGPFALRPPFFPGIKKHAWMEHKGWILVVNTQL
jgi:hypothetical protein